MSYRESDGENNWAISQGDGNFSVLLGPVVGDTIDGAAPLFGDFNSDGSTDFVYYDPERGVNRWFINDGTAHFTEYDDVLPTADLEYDNGHLYFGDWNGDGLRDVMFYDPVNGANLWWVNQGFSDRFSRPAFARKGVRHNSMHGKRVRHNSMDTLTYPDHISIQRSYDAYGYLDTITDVTTSPGPVYWQANARDARGNVIDAALGNGLDTIRDYNPATGHIQTILTGATLGTEVQSLSYACGERGQTQ